MCIEWDTVTKRFTNNNEDDFNEPQMEHDTMTVQTDDSKFPYTLDDLAYWIVEQEDGTMVKFSLDKSENNFGPGKGTATAPPSFGTGYGSGNYGKWCKHDPAPEPVYRTPDGKVSLFIADSTGTRGHWKEFDLLIDGGSVITPYQNRKDAKLDGDETLVKALSQYAVAEPLEGRLLSIDWPDRGRPPVIPEFWPALASQLKGRILCSCQGGHGRSGTSLVCLMLCYNASYSALDAITHLRAMHCARAIESVIQHQYINEVAKLLGRKQDALEADHVKSFRKRFLEEMKNPESVPFQARLILKQDDEVDRND